MKRLEVLAVAHTPPPTHGAAIVGEVVLSILKNNIDAVKTVELKSSNTIDSIGRFQMRKLFLAFFLIFKVLFNGLILRPKVVYYTASLGGLALARDTLIVCILKLIRTPRIVLHLHTIGVVKGSSCRVCRVMYKFLFSGVEIITLSEYAKSDLCQHISCIKKIHILPNFSPEEPVEGLKSKPGSVKTQYLFMSNMMEEKGYRLVLNFARDLVELGCLDFSINFAGSWGGQNEEKYFDDFVRKNGLDAYVYYLGLVTGRRKAVLFESSDVLLFPTFYQKESFPLVVLEAMAYGLGVVSTIHAAIPSIVGDKHALLLPPGAEICVSDVKNYISKIRYYSCALQSRYRLHFAKIEFQKRLLKILGYL